SSCTVAVPTDWVAVRTITVRPGSPVPLTVGVLSFMTAPSTGMVMVGAAGLAGRGPPPTTRRTGRRLRRRPMFSRGIFHTLPCQLVDLRPRLRTANRIGFQTCTSLKIEHSGTRARAVRFVVWQLAGILGASILATQHVLQITDSHLLVRRLASTVLQRRLIRPQRHVAIPALRRIVTVRFREGLRSRLAAARERVARLRGGTASIPPGLPSINLDGLHMPRLVRHVAMQPPLRSLGASLRQHLRPLHSPVDATRIGRYQIDSGRAAMPINIVLVLME